MYRYGKHSKIALKGLSHMEYILYHDESKVDGYWHGMLLIPAEKKGTLLKYLLQARDFIKYYRPLGIKSIRNKGKRYYCARAWVSIIVAAMVSQRKGDSIAYYSGERINGKSKISSFQEAIGAKFVLFREKDSLSKMSYALDYGSKVETTFRMGLKGGLHYLGSQDEQINIIKMHFDGHEHYNRNIDRERIVNRLGGLRNYCGITDRENLIDDKSSNHEKSGSQSYADCQLIQLTDLLIGSFRSVLNRPTREIHSQLAYPVKALTERYAQGYARMQNSKWRNSLCLSQCYLYEDKWRFEPLQLKKDDGLYQQTLKI
jgi:hypothetical protein